MAYRSSVGPDGLTDEDFIQTTFAAFKVLFADQWSPTRMEDAVFNSRLALPGAVPGHPARRGEAVCQPASGGRSWPRSAIRRCASSGPTTRTLSAGAKRKLTRPILYRLRSLYRTKAVRNILSQSDGLDDAALINGGAILPISLAGPAIQGEANLLGELILGPDPAGRAGQARATVRGSATDLPGGGREPALPGR